VGGPYLRDFWYLDLNKSTPGGWHKLPDYKLPPTSNLWLGWAFSLDPFTKRAYLFNGSMDVDYIDLVTETWGRIKCSYTVTPEDAKAGVKNGWAYPGSHSCDYASQIVLGDNEAKKILVFGGMHKTTSMGCNLFMELDLRTKTWRRISGSVIPPKDADHSVPGPRKYAASWVDKEQKRFYILYGSFDRDLYKRPDDDHAEDIPWTCSDCWMYDIDAEKWTRDRVRGNPPPPRTEFGLTFVSCVVLAIGQPADHAHRTRFSTRSLCLEDTARLSRQLRPRNNGRTTLLILLIRSCLIWTSPNTPSPFLLQTRTQPRL
jgi:hypothetical protein